MVTAVVLEATKVTVVLLGATKVTVTATTTTTTTPILSSMSLTSIVTFESRSYMFNRHIFTVDDVLPTDSFIHSLIHALPFVVFFFFYFLVVLVRPISFPFLTIYK